MGLTAQEIQKKIPNLPSIGLILGSGLGDLADQINSAVEIPYADIDGFPTLTIKGHQGALVIGELSGKTVVAMRGRSHYYEHRDMKKIAFAVRFMKHLGIGKLIVTNACGGINPALYPGALMIISDHINLMGDNPLIGPNRDDEGPRFPDMSEPYADSLRKIARACGKELGINLTEGIYTAVSGPYYFSGAELKMVRYMGSDTIGMSTVPEVIVANQIGLEVLGISCVTDMAIPESLQPLSHEEVVAVAQQTKPQFIALVESIIKHF